MSSYYYDASAAAALLIIGLVGLVFALAGYIILAIFLSKIFDKAGVQGKWRAWVPVYNYMVLAKLGDVSPWVVLIAFAVVLIPVLNYISWIVTLAVVVMVLWRVGLKLQKDAVWLLLLLIPGVGSLVWLGINAFDKSRWNTQIAPAPWASNGFLSDRTVWEGVPSQATSVPPANAYGAAPGYGQAPQGYAPPAQPGYTPPAQPGYAPPAQPGYPQPGYGQPAQPGQVPPVTPPPAAPAAPAVPPVTPPPAAPPAPPAAPTQPPAAPTDPTQPPAPPTNPPA
ncbi:large exoprotein [Microbacterium sp. NPDC055903]